VNQEVKREVKRINSSGWEYLKGQVKETLSWLSRHKWVATGFLLFVPAIYWYNFISYEKIPISISSPSVVASVPIIFSLMAFFIILMVIYACIPIIIFFTPVKKDCDKFLVPSSEAEFEKIRRSLFIRWISIQASICFVLFAAASTNLLGIGFILFLSLATSWLTVCLLKTMRESLKSTLSYLFKTPWKFLHGFFKSKKSRAACCKAIRLHAKFWGIVIVSTFVQILIVLLVLVSAFAQTREANFLEACATAFVWSFGVAITQLLAMMFLKRRWFRPNFLKRLILIFSGIIFAFGVYPAPSSFMLGKLLQITSSGARSCAVVHWTQAGTPVEVKALGDEKRPDRSRPLRIFVEMDGYYIVRILTEEEGGYVARKNNGRKDMSVEFIPRALVAGIDTCQPLSAKKQTASHRKKQHFKKRHLADKLHRASHLPQPLRHFIHLSFLKRGIDFTWLLQLDKIK